MIKVSVVSSTVLMILCLTGCASMKEFFASGSDSPDTQFSSLETRTRKLKESERQELEVALLRSLESKGKLDEAAQGYRKVLKQDPNNPVILHRLAVVFDRLGQTEKSKRLFRRALELDPKNANLLCDYGYNCYLRRDWEQAEQSYKQALQLKPSHKRAHNQLGLLFATRNQPKEALRQFHQAGLDESNAYMNLALANALENRIPQALEHYQVAAATASDPETHKAVEKKLGQLRRVVARLDRNSERTTSKLAMQPLTSGGDGNFSMQENLPVRPAEYVEDRNSPPPQHRKQEQSPIGRVRLKLNSAEGKNQ